MVYQDKYDNFWIKHFLLCNKISISICETFGWNAVNFAQLIQEEEKGVWTNSQMTKIFWGVDKVISELRQSDSGIVFESLEDEYNITIDEIAKWNSKDLDELCQTILISIIF